MGDIGYERALTYEKELTYFKMQMLQAEIAMNAMIAENKQREVEGKSMAYTSEHFFDLVERYGIHHNALLSALNSQA